LLTSTEIRSFFLDGPAGRLEALLNAGSQQASHAALVCHPHPLFGGTLHNKVVFRAMKALNGFGFPVLRFNFRGAGLSAGSHDRGRGEVEDVRAALDWLDREFQLPMIFAGFSFGAWVGLRVACPDTRVVALIALGTPVNVESQSYAYDFLGACAKPKLFVSGARDQFGPPGEVERIAAAAAEPKRLVRVPGADHFFEGHLPAVQEAMEDWLRSILPGAGQPL
jgi:alpha/beta superfamily hydrolase